jgi:hypothetical protein
MVVPQSQLFHDRIRREPSSITVCRSKNQKLSQSLSTSLFYLAGGGTPRSSVKQGLVKTCFLVGSRGKQIEVGRMGDKGGVNNPERGS